MAGVKGRSGRRCKRDENVMNSVNDASWRNILIDLNDKRLSKEIKRQISLEICKKTCPKEPLVDQSKHLTIIWEIDGKREIQAPLKSGHRLEIESTV